MNRKIKFLLAAVFLAVLPVAVWADGIAITHGPYLQNSLDHQQRSQWLGGTCA